MAVKPQPWAYECDQCKWRKVVTFKGDCIVEIPEDTCPKCFSKCISQVKLTETEFIAEKLVQLMLGRI